MRGMYECAKVKRLHKTAQRTWMCWGIVLRREACAADVQEPKEKPLVMVVVL